ncbi:MAG: DNA translocase FtsK [Rhodospirillales bacterium]
MPLPVAADPKNPPFLPEAAAAYLRRRGYETAGLVLAALGAVLLLALFAYDPGDPSLNHATGRAADNPFGVWGAMYADAALQGLGLAAALAPLAVMLWGVRLMRKHRIARPVWRLAGVAAAAVTAAVALAAAPAPEAWPVLAGLGGALGAAGAAMLTGWSGGLGLPWAGGVVTILAALLGAPLWMAAAGVSPAELAAAARGAGVLAFRAGARIGVRALELWRSELFRRARLKAWRERIEPAFTPDGAGAEYRMGVSVGGPGGGEEEDTEAETAPARPVQRAADPAAAAAERRARLSADHAVVEEKAAPKAGRKARAQNQGKLNLGPSGTYDPPPLRILAEADISIADATLSKEALEQNARMLAAVLADFGVKGEIVKVRPGPVVTLYELEPAPGTKTSRVIGLSDDIARSMSAVSVRVAVVPGRNVIGIELPNQRRETVRLREMLASNDYENAGAKLPLALGKDIGGAPIVVDMAKMPHLLIAGTTGSGKSVAMNTMILSLLYRLSPEQCRFIMVDPKMLELSVYNGIPHLLSPVVTDPHKAIVALKWAVREMEDRYRAMSQLGVRNVAGYNAKIADAARRGETLTRTVQTGFDDDGKPVYEEQPLGGDPLPYIVVVVDEMADLMLVAGKEVEAAIQRLAQMARAAGIHLLMATQRPSVDVITGTVKANFPTRISFQVISKIDSRTILGEQGAEQLLGQGDMLYMAGGGRITRVHGPFVDDDEVLEIVDYLKTQGEPAYMDSVTDETAFAAEGAGPGGMVGLGGVTGGGGMMDAAGGGSGDNLYDQAVAIVSREGKASTSFIQRHLKIGYNRAATIIERMEEQGVVSPADRVGRRRVLVGDHSE